MTSRSGLREWLEEHHSQVEGVWLVTYKKVVGARYVSRSDVLDELVAFGWCDGRLLRIDDERVMQRVSPRRTQPWAKSYKDRADRLVAEGLMHPRGQASVDDAKASGAWDAMNAVDALIVPEDLVAALAADTPADLYFAAFPPSVRRNILRWISSAKTPATRAKRVALTAAEAKLDRRVASNG